MIEGPIKGRTQAKHAVKTRPAGLLEAKLLAHQTTHTIAIDGTTGHALGYDLGETDMIEPIGSELQTQRAHGA